MQPAIYLGPDGKGHRLWDPLTRKVFQGSTVLFDEVGFGIRELKNICSMIGVRPSFDHPEDGNEKEIVGNVFEHGEEMNKILFEKENGPSLPDSGGGRNPDFPDFSPINDVVLPANDVIMERIDSTSDRNGPSEPNSGVSMNKDVSKPTREPRPQRQRNTPLELSQDKYSRKSHAKYCMMIHQCRKAQNDALSRMTPKGSRQALHGADKDKWMKPMVREYETHIKNHTFDMVSPQSITSKRGRVIGKNGVDEDGTKVYFIDGIWVYRIKTKNGVVVKFKARWCANGAGMDCDQEDTFSPVARMASVKTIFALAAVMGLTVRSGDVPGAYLQAPIDEGTEVYIRQPDGFVKEGKEDHWLRLRQAVYGLPQAGKLWYKVIHDFLLEIGFQQNGADPCIYWMRREGDLMVISLSVDDILDFATSEDLRKDVIDQLVARFDYIDDGPCEWFLGMKVTQNYEEVTLSQEDFIKTIVDEYPDAHKCNNPGDQGKTLGPNTSGKKSNFPYRSLCGKLRYVTMTRPDIEFPLNQCCKFQENPGEEHVKALLRIVGYLRKHSNMSIRYEKMYLKDPTLELESYCDASFADDKMTYRSSYGYYVALNGNGVTWKSKTTPSVATSTTESEYVALAEALKELLHVKTLLTEMEFRVKVPMIIFTDSNGAIGVTKFRKINNRTKHINVRYHFAREKVQDGTIDVRRVNTADNIADMFTKNLGKVVLDRLLKRTSLQVTA
jgi:hypothetical protein